MGCFVLCSDDQGFVYKDAIFISTHKLVGGVETPGKVKYNLLESLELRTGAVGSV